MPEFLTAGKTRITITLAPTPVYRHHMAVVRALTAGGRKVDHDQPC